MKTVFIVLATLLTVGLNIAVASDSSCETTDRHIDSHKRFIRVQATFRGYRFHAYTYDVFHYISTKEAYIYQNAERVCRAMGYKSPTATSVSEVKQPMKVFFFAAGDNMIARDVVQEDRVYVFDEISCTRDEAQKGE